MSRVNIICGRAFAADVDKYFLVTDAISARDGICYPSVFRWQIITTPIKSGATKSTDTEGR
jgi:hypothetical protein